MTLLPTVTASQLYDYVLCPHKVHLDSAGDFALRDPISAFVKLLWERGSSYEKDVVSDLAPDSFLTLKDLGPVDKEAATMTAMRANAPLIYGGRVTFEDLVGEPDLLIRRQGGYLAADIKSGQGEEGDADEDDGKLKPHYAVQVALYADILQRLGMGVGKVAEIWDVRGRHVTYDLETPRHSRTTETWWDLYVDCLSSVRAIQGGSLVTRGALASICKLCHWYSHCKAELTKAGDLTLIPQLGRALRDAMTDQISCLDGFANCNPDGYINGKKTIFPRLGVDRLRLFEERAQLLCHPEGKPYLRKVVELPRTKVEVYFDIETDPMNDIVYLHGFVERKDGAESFTAFFADGNSREEERAAFEGAVRWLNDRPDAAIYYYSKYERTMYRKLCERHPEVCSADDIERLFEPPRAIDLYYDVVYQAIEWPTHDHSIKTLARYLGFSWRDKDPSGAASIEWYQRWLETGDLQIKQRILDYNEDDCRATGILLDGIRAMATE